MNTDSTRPENINQNSIRAPFLTYLVLFLVFTLIHSFVFQMSPLTYFTYSLIAPLLILLLAQQKNVPFFLYPVAGFLLSALIQSLIHPNSRYIVANGLLGAVVWSISYLFSNWIFRNMYPVYDHVPQKQERSRSLPSLKKEDISVSDLLMDKGHVGFYLTLDTVVGPGLTTRRGYTTLGGGPDCDASPNTIMTYPDFIPQIPCKKIE